MVVSARDISAEMKVALLAVRMDLEIGGHTQPNGYVVGILAQIAMLNSEQTAATWKRLRHYAEAEFGDECWAHRLLADGISSKFAAADSR